MSVISQDDWGRIFARAWTDKAFSEAFEKDPRGALRAHASELGIDPEARFEVPEKPSHIDDDHAKKVAEGSMKPFMAPYCC